MLFPLLIEVRVTVPGALQNDGTVLGPNRTMDSASSRGTMPAGEIVDFVAGADSVANNVDVVERHWKGPAKPESQVGSLHAEVLSLSYK
jgi:hypothetical protein